MSGFGSQLDRIEAEEISRAIRLLLVRPLLTVSAVVHLRRRLMLRRGDVWEVSGQRRRSVLVVSHGMYND
jgi:hypothetical protein